MVSLDPKLQEYNSFATRNVGGISPSFGSLTVGSSKISEGYTPNYAQYDSHELSPVVDAFGVNEGTSEIAKKMGRFDGRLLA